MDQKQNPSSMNPPKDVDIIYKKTTTHEQNILTPQDASDDELKTVVMKYFEKDSEKDSEKPKQIKKTRCWKCNKKVGLVGLSCRCGYIYCNTHRYPEQHKCDFDFKKHGKDILKQNNKQIIHEKLEKL